MPDQTLYPSRTLPLDEYGILGIGSFNWDYILKSFPIEEIKEKYKLRKGTGIRIKDKHGNVLLEIAGPYTPDNRKSSDWVYRRGEKHNSGDQKPKKYLEFILGEDAIKRPGGGIINFAKGWLSHSSEIPIGLVMLRGRKNMAEGSIEDILEGAFYQNLASNEENDAGNVVILPRTIIRGKQTTFENHIYFDPKFPFKIGTVIINSLESRTLANVGIDFYLRERENGHYIGGVVAITPKMVKSFDLIEKKAIPNGFIPIFNPTDLVRYSFGNNSAKRKVRKKQEKDVSYKDIFEAIKVVRSQQKGNPQRIYVTLGKYGTIGVGTNGTIYRINTFSATGTNETGAGDVFCSLMARFEHKRHLNKRDSLPIYEIMAYASAAAALHIDGYSPSMSAIYKKVTNEASLDYENIGNIDTLDVNCQKFKRKLSEVGNHPVSSKKYETLTFAKGNYHLN